MKLEEGVPDQDVHRGDPEGRKSHMKVAPSWAVQDCSAAKSLAGAEPAAAAQSCEKRGRRKHVSRTSATLLYKPSPPYLMSSPVTQQSFENGHQHMPLFMSTDFAPTSVELRQEHDLDQPLTLSREVFAGTSNITCPACKCVRSQPLSQSHWTNLLAACEPIRGLFTLMKLPGCARNPRS